MTSPNAGPESHQGAAGPDAGAAGFNPYAGEAPAGYPAPQPSSDPYPMAAPTAPAGGGYPAAQPGYPPVPYGQPGTPQPVPGQPAGAWTGYPDQYAPFGYDPVSGLPYSEKSKMTAGLLQILLPGFGAGRFYMGQPGLAIAQIAVSWLTFGVGVLWPFIDGIMILTGQTKDANGLPLRPSS